MVFISVVREIDSLLSSVKSPELPMEIENNGDRSSSLLMLREGQSSNNNDNN